MIYNSTVFNESVDTIIQLQEELALQKEEDKKARAWRKEFYKSINMLTPEFTLENKKMEGRLAKDYLLYLEENNEKINNMLNYSISNDTFEYTTPGGVDVNIQGEHILVTMEYMSYMLLSVNDDGTYQYKTNPDTNKKTQILDESFRVALAKCMAYSLGYVIYTHDKTSGYQVFYGYNPDTEQTAKFTYSLRDEDNVVFYKLE